MRRFKVIKWETLVKEVPEMYIYGDLPIDEINLKVVYSLIGEYYIDKGLNLLTINFTDNGLFAIFDYHADWEIFD